MPEPTYAELAEKYARTQETLEKAKEVIRLQKDEIEALNASPNPVGVFRRWYSAPDRLAIISVSGRDSRVTVSPDVPSLEPGERVLLNDASVVIDTDGFAEAGTVAEVTQLLDDGRMLVECEGGTELVLERAESVAGETLEEGATVLVDTGSRLVLELLRGVDELARLWLEEIPDVTYEDIGGLDEQLGKIRDAVELPYLHPGLFRRMKLKAPKGILLYGPPGTGKTMIAKAVANKLASGKPGARPHFLSVKGPELLDKWVGESERKIREVFSRARHLGSDGDPVVVFFDEMESIFRVRGSGVSSDVESTLVPQLLTELDGMEELNNVIVIGASNRQDLIDPAILRPGRLDVKIQIGRPDEDAAHAIFLKYLTANLPYSVFRDDPAAWLATNATEALYAEEKDTEFLEVTYANGTKEKLHFGDFASGAMIAGIVSRAKTSAIKDHLDGKPLGIHLEHLRDAIREEFRENEDLPNTTSPEDWARISGFKGEDIVRVRRIFREAPKKTVEDLKETGQYL